MIEEIVRNFLKEELGVPLYFEHKVGVSDSFLVIEKIAGRMKNHLKGATVAIQSYAPSLYQAAVLNESVKSAMMGLTVLDAVHGVHLSSDYHFTDWETKSYRYQAVFVIDYY